MKDKPKPFLNADSIGKEYKTRGGDTARVVLQLKSGEYLVADDYSGWTVYDNGRYLLNKEDQSDLIPPAPPEPERRTVWLNVYPGGGNSFCIWPSKKDADMASNENRQGEAVPVNLERQPDGNWKVVAEKTAKELAAEAMYDGLRKAQNFLANSESATAKGALHIISTALAKARGEKE